MTTAPFTSAGIGRGFAKALSRMPGVLVYGAAFGLIADQAGLTLLQALLMSAFVYSGSAQLVAANILASGPSPVLATAWTLFVTILVINARYLLFSASMRPWMGGLPPTRTLPTLFVLGDGSWMLSLYAHEKGERDAGFIFGSSAAMFGPWLGGTWLGYVGGGFIPDPKRLALDFLMAAFAAAMMAGMSKSRFDLVIIAISAAVAAAVYVLGAPNWAPVIAGLAGGFVAFMRVLPPAGAHNQPDDAGNNTQ